MRILNPLLIALLDLWVGLGYRLTSQKYTLEKAASTSIVVCMTSHPGRIKHAWLSLESLFRQTDRDFRLVLVLADSQFPRRKLPNSIRRLTRKGLEILWVQRDGRSFDHLWPAYRKFPEAAVISVDDDKFFSASLVEKLRTASVKYPSTIIGWRGWQMRLSDGSLAFGHGWERATEQTPSNQLFMPPGNGSFYPPGSLPAGTGDYLVREQICPDADDVWYWAMARLGGRKSVCLGEANHRAVWQQKGTVSLASAQPGPAQFEQVLRYFDLEEPLLRELPEDTRQP